jgi:hypothetical protein
MVTCYFYMFACVLVFEYWNKQALAEMFCNSAGPAHVFIWLPFCRHLDQASIQKQNFTSYFCTMPSIKHTNAMESLTVKQLQQLLRQKGLPVTGRKSELKVQLNQAAVENQGPKPKPWQHSTAKKDLKRALLDPKSPIHGMSMEQIRASDNRYKHDPNFPKYYNDLKVRVALERECIQLDDMLVRMHLRDCPRPDRANRGYPHWITHAVKALLEIDVLNDQHKEKKPQELRKTRREYREFPRDVFAKRVSQEVAKQRAARFWADKRNKSGMKKYLEDVAKRAA